MMSIKIIRYQKENGDEPFTEWFRSLRDKLAKSRIATRLDKLEASGNYGDSEPVGEGVIELRIHIGPGYRIYCAPYEKALIVLFTGGDKNSQKTDIKKAKELWADWKGRQA